MKTKIVYISGNEVFDVRDIRAAFEEVRTALNLDKTTVLFGVPVDEDDAGLMSESEIKTEPEIYEPIHETIINEPIIKETKEIIEPIPEQTDYDIIAAAGTEIQIEDAPKKRGRPSKEPEIKEDITETTIESDEPVIPILSVLSGEKNVADSNAEEIEIIPEISDTVDEESVEITETDEQENVESDEADLEKLLSAMTPLAEDALSEKQIEEPVAEINIEQQEDDVSVDATLEQLATEFAESQDKIATESKSSSRSKIGKLRNILPFKQSKHKDNGLGDLFGWAGIAANDEDFSVPGFFTNAASKK